MFSRIWISTLSLLLSGTLAHAATYYVATTGSDSNPGTQAAPFQTMNRGAKALQSGDTLIVRGGRYHERMLNNLPSGRPGAPTTLRNAPGEDVTLVQLPSNQDCAFYQEHRSHLVVEGMNLDGSWHTIFGLCTASTSSHQTFRNFKIYHNRGNGAILFQGGSNFLLDGLHVFENGNDPSRAGYRHGIYMSASNSTIQRCVVHDNLLGYGMQLYPSPANVTVRRNRFYNNRNNLYIGGPGHVIVNNLFSQARDGIRISSSRVEIAYNTVYGHTEHGIIWMNNERGGIRHSIAFGNRRNVATPTPGAQVVNVLTDDPLFVDAARGDFRLRQGSPAIDEGEPLSFVRDDFAGTPRPQGRGYDIGAWEYRPGSAPGG